MIDEFDLNDIGQCQMLKKCSFHNLYAFQPVDNKKANNSSALQ